MEAVAVCHENGTPYIVVPCVSLWSLVEYLSVLRVHVVYSYEGEGFRVAFPHHELAGVEQIVADWGAYRDGVREESRAGEAAERRLEGAAP